MNAIITSDTAPDSGAPRPFTVDIADGQRFYTITVRAHVPCTAETVRERSRLALEVAAELEAIAAREHHTYTVDKAGARDGVVLVEVAPEGAPLTSEGHDIMLEITIDACSSAGLGPTEF